MAIAAVLPIKTTLQLSNSAIALSWAIVKGNHQRFPHKALVVFVVT